MAVTIRLQRQGAKKHPNYLVVALDSAKKRDGAYLQKLGQYFPSEKDPKKKLKADLEKIRAWQSKGAQVSQTVGQLLKKLAQ